MRISHKYKFIFFCSPKTASESIRKLLTPYSDVLSTVYKERTSENPFYSHMSPYETEYIFKKKGWDFDAYNKFVFVRNPWARLVSLYIMIIESEKCPEKDNKSDFLNWLYTIKTYGSGGGGDDSKRWRKYGTYSLDNYTSDNHGKILVNRVLKLENIKHELIPFLKELGLPDIENINVPYINNRAKKYHYTDYYTKEAEQYIEKLYSYDIKTFNYIFGK